MRPTPHVVSCAGKPIVNGATVISESGGIALVEIDLASKRCDILAVTPLDGGIEFVFALNEYSANLADTTEEHTYIVLPEFAGWDVWCWDCAKYTARVVLRKDGVQYQDEVQ